MVTASLSYHIRLEDINRIQLAGEDYRFESGTEFGLLLFESSRRCCMTYIVGSVLNMLIAIIIRTGDT